MITTGIHPEAASFAKRAHGAQLRKYTGEPYITHPKSVAALVAQAGGDDAMVAAAWLHDVVEDTPVTLDEVRAAFGDDVADLVYWLTDVSRPEDGNRAIRKAKDRAHLAQAPDRAKAIKLADLIDNTSSIVAHDWCGAMGKASDVPRPSPGPFRKPSRLTTRCTICGLTAYLI